MAVVIKADVFGFVVVAHGAHVEPVEAQVQPKREPSDPCVSFGGKPDPTASYTRSHKT